MDEGTQNALGAVIASFPEAEQDMAHAWLNTPNGGAPSLSWYREPRREATQRPDETADAIRSVVVVGGGTAGYLSALALKKKRPWLDVQIVETPRLPIIGVGEATTPGMLLFLHHYLGIDPHELYQRVRPTWKFGIKFDWGSNPSGFMAPFDWGTGSIGVLGALHENGTLDGYTLQALLMQADRAPVYETRHGPMSLMKHLPFAYHLDNASFVTYLQELAREREIRYGDAEVKGVIVGTSGEVDELILDEGRRLKADFYIDCSGFRSRLLEQALGIPFVSYAESLLTDRAMTFNLEHDGHIRPYTTAKTMNSGWCWRIPTPDSDHLGYVFSSGFMSDDEATKEVVETFGYRGELKKVHFRVGRHTEAWRGNVMAIGNSFAFVEPLESTGLLMIVDEIQTLVSSLPVYRADPSPRDAVNAGLNDRWDSIRWFLSLHYKFNERLASPFWKAARNDTNIKGAEALLALFAGGAPLHYRRAATRGLPQRAAPTFFELAGVDTILLGQGVPARLLDPGEPHERWRMRRRAAQAFVDSACLTARALELFHADPALNDDVFNAEDSWASLSSATRVGMS